MRLADIRGGKDAGVPEDVRAELAALDAALAGEEVPAGMDGLSTLVADLRAQRIESDQDFAAALDNWAATGFERGERPGLGSGAPGKPAGARGRFSASGPRRLFPVMAAVATLAVIVTAVTQVPSATDDQEDVAAPQRAELDGSSSEDFDRSTEDALSNLPGVAEDSSALKDGRDVSFNALRTFRSEDRAGFQRGQDERQVERDAQLELATPVGDVPDVTNEAIQVVESANGVVLNSRVSGTDKAAVARLELEVPTGKLDGVIADLSDLADVKSRTEQAQDITQPFVTTEDRLIGLEAERVNLANRIEDALTDDEVASLQAQLASVNRRLAEARSDLRRLQVRASFSTVQLEITSAGAQAEEDDGWSLGDALDDAGKVIEVAAGVALISGAILVPVAIIAAIGFFAHGAASRRARERALDS